MTGHFGVQSYQGPKGLEERVSHSGLEQLLLTWLQRLKGLGRPVMEGPEPRSPEGFHQTGSLFDADATGMHLKT